MVQFSLHLLIHAELTNGPQFLLWILMDTGQVIRIRTSSLVPELISVSDWDVGWQCIKVQ